MIRSGLFVSLLASAIAQQGIHVVSAAMVIYYTYALVTASTFEKIHHSIACVLAMTTIVDPDALPLVIANEAAFTLFAFKNRWIKTVAWAGLWTSIVAAHVLYFYGAVHPIAGVYLVVHAYFFVRQARWDARQLNGHKIDPDLKLMFASFSGILKFASLVKLGTMADIRPFLVGAAVNISTTGMTSACLLVHAIASGQKSASFILTGAIAMTLVQWIEPFYDFNEIASYAVDALFFLSMWY